MTHRHAIAALAATFGLFLMALPAVAGDTLGDGAARAVQAGDIVLRYRPAELASRDGRARIYARLQDATAQVCARYEDRELARQRVHQRCVEQVLAAAVGQVHDAGLQALHDARHAGQRLADAQPLRTARR